MRTAYLLPLTIAALTVAVAALAYRAGKRRGYGPLILGGVAACGLLVGKFVLDSNRTVCGGVAALIAASLWNSWPKKGVPSAPAETLLQLGSIKKER